MPLINFIAYFVQEILVLQKGGILEVVFRMANAGKEHHHADFGPKTIFYLDILNFVSQSHRD